MLQNVTKRSMLNNVSSLGNHMHLVIYMAFGDI